MVSSPPATFRASVSSIARLVSLRSRERSETNRAIDETLARKVAGGELTIDEALAEHREG